MVNAEINTIRPPIRPFILDSNIFGDKIFSPFQFCSKLMVLVYVVETTTFLLSSKVGTALVCSRFGRSLHC